MRTAQIHYHLERADAARESLARPHGSNITRKERRKRDAAARRRITFHELLAGYWLLRGTLQGMGYPVPPLPRPTAGVPWPAARDRVQDVALAMEAIAELQACLPRQLTDQTGNGDL